MLNNEVKLRRSIFEIHYSILFFYVSFSLLAFVGIVTNKIVEAEIGQDGRFFFRPEVYWILGEDTRIP